MLFRLYEDNYIKQWIFVSYRHAHFSNCNVHIITKGINIINTFKRIIKTFKKNEKYVGIYIKTKKAQEQDWDGTLAQN